MIEDGEIIGYINDYYKQNYPEYIITKRISDKLIEIIRDGFKNITDNYTFEHVKPTLNSFFEKEKIIMFIDNRQPNTMPVSKEVFDKLQDTIKNSQTLFDYEITHVYRKSNHIEDNYLYSAIGYNMVTGKYACWSSWNMSTESLNNGHYNLESEDEAIGILKEQFNDITGNPDKYGLLSNEYDNSENVRLKKEKIDIQNGDEQKKTQNERINIVSTKHKGR